MRGMAYILYNGYPNSDLLPIEPPEDNETLESFVDRIKDCGDPLFIFMCNEAKEDCDNPVEFLNRLERIIQDVASVKSAVLFNHILV